MWRAVHISVYHYDMVHDDCKSFGISRDGLVFSKTNSMKNSSIILYVIVVLRLSGQTRYSRYDASIHALNKMISMNSSNTRMDSCLLVVLSFMDSILLYPVSIDHLTRYCCSTNASTPFISPRLNSHTVPIGTLMANVWIIFSPFLYFPSKMISGIFSCILSPLPEIRACSETAFLLPT